MARLLLPVRRELAGALASLLLTLCVASPAASAARSPGPIVFTSNRTGQWDLWTMQADGSSPVSLTNDKAIDAFPAWSPDGRRIAWTKGGFGPEGEIWVMDADGSNAHQVTFNAFSDFNATWSPDASEIAFRSFRNGNRDIYVISADGTNERRLTTDPASDYACDWSPDGTRIAWTSARNGHQAVYTMKTDGSDVQKVTPDELEGGLPGWSPDGTKILFSDALCATCSESDLWVVNPDGSGLRQITDTPANELADSWSRDGASVVGDYSKLTPSEKHVAKGDVAVWDVATGALTKLTDSNGSEDGHPDWVAGGRPSATADAEASGAPANPSGGVSPESALQPRDTAAWSRVGGGVANIEYTLPKAGHVRVRVFDVAGREVARPVDEWQSAGPHVTTFAFGAATKQVFLYRVECGGRSTSGKISIGP